MKERLQYLRDMFNGDLPLDRFINHKQVVEVLDACLKKVAFIEGKEKEITMKIWHKYPDEKPKKRHRVYYISENMSGLCNGFENKSFKNAYWIYESDLIASITAEDQPQGDKLCVMCKMTKMIDSFKPNEFKLLKKPLINATKPSQKEK